MPRDFLTLSGETSKASIIRQSRQAGAEELTAVDFSCNLQLANSFILQQLAAAAAAPG